jgi:hypothetical protein
VLLAQFLEAPRAATRRARCLPWRWHRLLKLRCPGDEGHAADEVATPVGQRWWLMFVPGTGVRDAHGTLANQIQLIGRVADREHLLVACHRAPFETFDQRDQRVLLGVLEDFHLVDLERRKFGRCASFRPAPGLQSIRRRRRLLLEHLDLRAVVVRSICSNSSAMFRPLGRVCVRPLKTRKAPRSLSESRIWLNRCTAVTSTDCTRRMSSTT